MRRAELFEKVEGWHEALIRCGVPKTHIKRFLNSRFDGPSLSRKIRPYKALQSALFEERLKYGHMDDASWETLKLMGGGEYRELRRLQIAVKAAWKAMYEA